VKASEFVGTFVVPAGSEWILSNSEQQ